MNFFENLIYFNDFQLKVRKFPSKCVHLIEIKQKKYILLNRNSQKHGKVNISISVDGGDIVL